MQFLFRNFAVRHLLESGACKREALISSERNDSHEISKLWNYFNQTTVNNYHIIYSLLYCTTTVTYLQNSKFVYLFHTHLIQLQLNYGRFLRAKLILIWVSMKQRLLFETFTILFYYYFVLLLFYYFTFILLFEYYLRLLFETRRFLGEI